ncbi:MAG: SOS response-associated peptidase [Chloroflexi bacterium]|nr:SOS response-associated peptidase [Chloroflexota bacterium]
MCGRFVLTADAETLQMAFDLETTPAPLVPRYNIAPTQPVAVITNAAPKELTYHRWGLVPSWAKDISIGSQMINARAETAAEKPSFKNALRRRRCLIPASGFYEWPKKGQNPLFIHLKDNSVFAFAGLWEIWRSPDGDELHTCSILTTEPNDYIGQFHNRMAVILPRDRYADWLYDGELQAAEALSILTPVDEDKMTAYEVSKRVNSPAFDSPENIEPLGTQAGLL